MSARTADRTDTTADDARTELAARLRLTVGRLNRRIRIDGHESIPPLQLSALVTVEEYGPLRLSGSLAWLMWLAVHLVYIVGFKHRLTTVLHWLVSFLGRGRAERVATEQQILGRLALEQVRSGRFRYSEPDEATRTALR